MSERTKLCLNGIQCLCNRINCRFFFFVQLNTDFSEIYPVVQYVHDTSEIPFVTFSSGNMHVIYCMHFRGIACILAQFFCVAQDCCRRWLVGIFAFSINLSACKRNGLHRTRKNVIATVYMEYL